MFNSTHHCNYFSKTHNLTKVSKVETANVKYYLDHMRYNYYYCLKVNNLNSYHDIKDISSEKESYHNCIRSEHYSLVNIANTALNCLCHNKTKNS